MTIWFASVRPPGRALPALLVPVLVLGFVGLTQAAALALDRNPGNDPGVPAASGNIIRKNTGAAAPTSAKQTPRRESLVAGHALRGAPPPSNEVDAGGKREHVPEIPCFKMKLCE